MVVSEEIKSIAVVSLASEEMFLLTLAFEFLLGLTVI